MVVLAVLFLASCGGEEVNQESLNLKVSEEASAQIEALTTEYAANCEARMTTEVKAKTDSIVAAKLAAAGAQ